MATTPRREPHLAKHRRYPEEIKQRARDLRDAGATLQAIADELGASTDTIRQWCDPAVAEKNRRRANSPKHQARKRAKWRKASAGLLRAERDALAARSNNGDLTKAYAFVRKAATELDRALESAASGEQRREIRAALTATHTAEDEIVHALGSQ